MAATQAAAAAAAAYPAESSFKQAESLMAGLLDTYRGATDAADMANIAAAVDEAVRAARAREFRAAAVVKDLAQRVGGAEAEATYDDARRAHERRMASLTAGIGAAKEQAAAAGEDIRAAGDQQAQLAARRRRLEAARRELARLELAEPEKLQRISLYAHVSGLAFDYVTFGRPVVDATLCDAASGDIKQLSVAVGSSSSGGGGAASFDDVNALWAELSVPQL